MRSLKLLIFLVIPFHFISALFVKPISKFPFLVDSIFQLQILPDQSNEKLSVLVGDTMLIQIVDRTGLMKQRQILHYGIKDSIENEIKGEFIDVKIWEVNSNGSAIELSILFKKKCNYYIFEIYFIDAPSKELLRKKLNDLNLAKRIYQATINLFKPSTLQLIINTITTNTSRWNINDTVVAICRASDGIPVEIPMFENFDKFEKVKSTLSLERNERKITFKVRQKNHLTNLRCVAGKVFKNHLIKVLHNPSKLYIDPKINVILKPKSTIKCYVVDGYPQPKIEWHLNDGPLNSSQFYKISENGSHLYINDKCPLKSKWEFTCQVNDISNKSMDQLNKKINFFIETKLIGQCNAACLHARLLKVEYSTRNLDKFIVELIFNSGEKKIEKQNDYTSIERLIRKDQLSSLMRILNENKLKILNKSIDKIETQIKDFQNKLEEIYYFITQNKSMEIDELKQELGILKKHMNFTVSNNIKLIIKYLQINGNIKKFQQQINEKILKIENFTNFNYNQLKQDNIKLKQSLALLTNNKNNEIKKLNNTIMDLRKKMETQILKEARGNNINCSNIPHIGKILTKGLKGEIHEWILGGFSKLQNKAFSIFSPSFYSFFWGYNMRLGMHSDHNNYQLNKMINISFQLVPGQFDAHLLWPMKNDIELSIKNQITGKSHFHKTFKNIFQSINEEVFFKTTCADSKSFHTFQMRNEIKMKEFIFKDKITVVCKLIINY